MKLSYLERASDYDVEKWLNEELKLTPYQKELLNEREIVRFSPFYFYQRKKKEEELYNICLLFCTNKRRKCSR